MSQDKLLSEEHANGTVYACVEKACQPGLHVHDRPYLILSNLKGRQLGRQRGR